MNLNRSTPATLLAAFGALSLVGGAATAAEGDPVRAGELIVEPPTLISLGFEWYDRRRRESQRVGRRSRIGAHGDAQWRDGSAAAARAERAHGRTSKRSTTRRRTCSPAACSSSPRTRSTRFDSRSRIPTALAARRIAIVNVRTRAEPQAFAGGTHVPRLSARLRGAAARARVPRAARGVLHGRARRRLEPRVAAARAARRHDSRARRCLQRLRPLQLQPRDPARSSSTCCGTPWDGTFYPHARTARPSGRSPSRPPATARWSSTATATTCCSTSWAPTTPTSKASRFATRIWPSKRARRALRAPQGLTVKHSTFDDVGVAIAQRLVGLARTSTSPTTCSIGRNDPSVSDRLVQHLAVEPGVPISLEQQRMKSYYAVVDLRLGPRRRVQPRHELPRRHRSRDLRHARRLPEHAARPHAGVDRLLRQRRLERARQLLREPTAACTTCASSAIAASTRRRRA